MTITELLTMSPEAFKAAFFDPETRESGYEDLSYMFQSLSGDAMKESPLGPAICTLNVDEYVDLILFLLNQSFLEKSDEGKRDDQSYMCVWRSCEAEYMRNMGVLQYMGEVLPVAFKRFAEADPKDLYRYLIVSHHDSSEDNNSCLLLDLYVPEIQLCNPGKAKELQRAAKEYIVSEIRMAMGEAVDEKELKRVGEELQGRVDDEKFDGLIFCSQRDMSSSNSMSRMLHHLMSTAKSRSEDLDDVFDGFNKEDEGSKKKVH